MILQLLLFFLFLFFLFFLGQKITNLTYNLLLLLTKSESFSVGFISLLFLPGTIIHELSHFLMATILRVPTGELSVLPKIENKVLKSGHLMIGKTDPFRFTLIGLAPLIIGLIIIYLIGNLFLSNVQQPIINNQTLLLFIIFYFLFSVSSTMFSSKKDLESFWVAIPLVFLFFLSFYLIGVRIFLDTTLVTKLNGVITNLNYYLLVTLIIAYSIFFLLSLGNYLLKN